MSFAERSSLVLARQVPEPGSPSWAFFVAWAIDNEIRLCKGTRVVPDGAEGVVPQSYYSFDYPHEDHVLVPGCFLVRGRFGGWEQVEEGEFNQRYVATLCEDEEEPF